MKTKILTSIIIVFLASCTSNTPTSSSSSLCNDGEYIAFKTDSQNNNNNSFEVIENTIPSLQATTFNTLDNVSYTSYGIGNNSSTYDSGSNTMVFIDQFNNNKQLISFNTQSNSTSISTLSTSNVVTAPVYLNGSLYVLEVDFSLNQAIYLKEVVSITNGALSSPLLTLSMSNIQLNTNAMGDLFFATTDGVSMLYFLSGNSVLEIDINSLTVTTKPLPDLPTSLYNSLEYINDTEVLSIEMDTSVNPNEINLVSLDFSGTNISKTVLIPNVPVNFESISLRYKNCGEALIILTHFDPTSSEVLEVNLSNNAITSRDFPNEFIFGMIHKN